MTDATIPIQTTSPISKAQLSAEQIDFLGRFDLSKGHDALLQIQTNADDAIARQLLKLGLIAYINDGYIFDQLTPRSEERRVGNACVSTCRVRRSRRP